MLGLSLVNQIVTGLALATCYRGGDYTSFWGLITFIESYHYGWLMRYVHINGASIYFFFMFIHIGRGLYYSSYLFVEVWLIGVRILLLTIAAAFLGYVLPFNQISY